jgi:divalent metal cation (Fe/Co/Zn/Cd) transporter
MHISATRTDLIQRGERLEYFTILWNSIEGLLSVGAGIAAGSIALVGFGLDSFIEVASGSALLWRMKADRDVERRERVERISLRVVGFCFLALAAYVAIDSVHSLLQRTGPERSILGIAIGVASLFVMPLLARAKRNVGKAIDSPAMIADSQQTQFCTYLSAVLVAGLLLNFFFGWWWSDSVAGMVMVPIIANEGIEAVRGKQCSCGEVKGGVPGTPKSAGHLLKSRWSALVRYKRLFEHS